MIVAKTTKNSVETYFFDLFFSCGDKRWPEVFVSILKQTGYTIGYKSKSSGVGDQEFSSILVNGIPLDEFLLDKDVHDLFKNNVYTITR